MPEEASADAFLDRAQEARSQRECLKWIRKARELEPEHVDAALVEINMTAKEPCEQELRLFELQQKAENQLRKQGFFTKEDIGHFWGLIETRPYMRVCHSYVEALLMNRKMRLAAKECESILRLCTSDNLGIRYTLIHIYAYLEEEKAAQKFFKNAVRSGERDSLLQWRFFSISSVRRKKHDNICRCCWTIIKTQRSFFPAMVRAKWKRISRKQRLIPIVRIPWRSFFDLYGLRLCLRGSVCFLLLGEDRTSGDEAAEGVRNADKMKSVVLVHFFVLSSRQTGRIAVRICGEFVDMDRAKKLC